MNSPHPPLDGVLLATQLFVVGLYAGIHWFNYLGGLPALQDLERAGTFVDYWQNVDRYMGRRMRVFGAILLASCALSAIWFGVRQQWTVAAGLLLTLALLLADVVVAVCGNVPLNERIQSWRVDAIPGEWRDVRGALVHHFRLRGVISLAAFEVLVYTVVVLWARTPAVL